jgi:hypothetical protein
MARRKQHIDDILQSWKYETEEVSVRIVPGVDKRDVLQMRVDLGVLQLEVAGRPTNRISTCCSPKRCTPASAS